MKLKNIFGLISAMSLALVACSEESVIDETDVMGKPDTSFDITLVTDGVETKAAPAGYEYATAEEIKIQTCAVAVFAGDGDSKMVGFKYATFNGQSNTHLGSKEAYEVKDVETKSGNVKVLVVANPSLTEVELKALNTYNKFKAQSISHTDANSFVASNLIKFGEVTQVLGTDTRPSIVVPLTQVAARVDVTYNVNVESGWTATLEKNTIKNINVQSKVFLPVYDRNNYIFGSQALKNKSGVAISQNKMSFYTYEKNTAIDIEVPVTLRYNKRTERRTYNLSLLPTYVEGKCSTNGIVHGHYYEVTGNMTIDVELNCKINWEVQTLEPVRIDIPDFN